MDASVNNTKAFTDAIKRMAAEKCKQIDEETEALRKQRLKSLKDDAKARYKGYADFETVRINAKKNREICEAQEEAKKQLAGKRSELTEAVFASVRERLTEFSKTEEYKELLLSLAREAIKEFEDGELEFFVKPDDIKYSSDIKKLTDGCTVTACDEIELGGIKVRDKKTSCLADSTLDTGLSSQREWFLAQSGLKI